MRLVAAALVLIASSSAADTLPVPFECKQSVLGKTYKKGASYTMSIEAKEEGSAATTDLVTYEVIEAGPKGYKNKISKLDAAKKVTGSKTSDLRPWTIECEGWDFTTEDTTVTKEKVTVPAGTFATTLYTQKRASGTTVKIWFIDDAPGLAAKSDTQRTNGTWKKTTLEAFKRKK